MRVLLPRDQRCCVIELPDGLQNSVRQQGTDREPCQNRAAQIKNSFCCNASMFAADRVEGVDDQKIARRASSDIRAAAAQHRHLLTGNPQMLHSLSPAVISAICVL